MHSPASREIRVHAFPGMGADERMYPAPWSQLPGFRAHNWYGCSEARTIPELAELVCARAGIAEGDILVGSSLGGMVACEITRLRRIPLLILVGSAMHPREVRRPLLALTPLIHVTPMPVVRFVAAAVPGTIATMIADSDPVFIRRMVPALANWTGCDVSSTRTLRIHGRWDPLIRPPADADLLLNGRHAIALSHPEECVRFVAARIAENSPSLGHSGDAAPVSG